MGDEKDQVINANPFSSEEVVQNNNKMSEEELKQKIDDQAA